MFFSRRQGEAAWLLLALGIAGCGRSSPTGEMRLAVLPIENQTGRPDLDWLPPAGPLVLAAQLRGAAGLKAVAVENEREARLGQATHILASYLTTQSGHLLLSGTVRPVTAEWSERVITVTEKEPLGLLAAAARIWRNDPAPPPSANASALRAFGSALQSRNAAEADAQLAEAVRLDPHFAMAYAAWARARLNRNDRAGAEAVLAQAEQQATHFSPPDRAELQLLSAAIRQDAGARAAALAELSKANPQDRAVQEQAANALLAARDTAGASRAFEQLVQGDPQNKSWLNSLGYLYALQGDLGKAKAVLERYRAAYPNEPNPLDSLGEVSLMRGDFGGAERYLVQAFEKDPQFLNGGTLWKAAHARLMTGDVAGADQLHQRYLDAIKKKAAALVPLRSAQWLYGSGRVEQAFQTLKTEGTSYPPDILALHEAQLSLWEADRQDWAAAGQRAAKLAQMSTSPGTRSLLEIVLFTLQTPASAATWQSRAEQRYAQPGQESLRDVALGHALLVHHHFREAVPVWQRILQRTNPLADNSIPVMLAWADLESGRADEAAGLLSRFMVPNADDTGLFFHLAKPREWQLHGQVAEKAGKSAEAQQAYRLYCQLSPKPSAGR